MKRSNNVATENGEPNIAGRFRAHCAAVAFPSLRRFLTRRTCLLARENSAAPKRMFSSALVSAGWRAQRENDRRKERGILAGHPKRIVGPT